jgi:phage protein D
VPWRAGLNVYGGSAMAKLETANRALAVVRNGRLIFQTLKSLAAARALPLQPGDVLRLADYG